MPEMTEAQIQEDRMVKVATPIVKAGFKKGLNEDDIKGQLFDPNGKAQIPFGFLNKIFKRVGIETGLIVDPAVVKAEIEAQVQETDWESAESYSQFEAICEDIVAEVNGATLVKVVNLARAQCVADNIEIPKKVKAPKAARTKGGKAVRAIADAFLVNPKASKQEIFDAVRPCTKDSKNTIYYMKLHYLLAYACANQLTLEDAFTATSAEAYPVELVETVTDEVEETVEA